MELFIVFGIIAFAAGMVAHSFLFARPAKTIYVMQAEPLDQSNTGPTGLSIIVIGGLVLVLLFASL